MNTYYVCIENKPAKRFDKAEDAVEYAYKHVYRDAVRYWPDVDDLRAGRVVTYEYGFGGVDIIPQA